MEESGLAKIFERDKKLLIIGNGFDLAHKLPTRYSDFLNFADCIKVSIDRGENYFPDEMCKKVKDYVDNFEESIGNNQMDNYQKKLKEVVDENIWIRYFLNAPGLLIDNWVDFEREIKEVIKILERKVDYEWAKAENSNIKEERDKFFDDVFHKIDESLFSGTMSYDLKKISNMREEILSGKKDNVEMYRKKLKEFTDRYISLLEKNLDNLIMALKIYINQCVNEIEINDELSFIKEKNIDYVLSFNYSNTFERKYKAMTIDHIDYIHGKADEDLKDNNMVLGIDEYLDNDKKEYNSNFIYFKKYYQRIIKTHYMKFEKWIENIDECYIYGHSLDETDKEILSKIFNDEHIKIYIFFLDENNRKQLITNLIKLINREELIKRTSDQNKTIVFKKIEKSDV